MKKNNAWNIRHLVDESFIPSTQPTKLKIVGFHICFSSGLTFSPTALRSNQDPERYRLTVFFVGLPLPLLFHQS